MIVLLFVLVAALFQMNTIIWIAKNTANVLVIALVVIFQPEMRKALENLGRKNMLISLFPFDMSKGENVKFSDKTINEMVKACYEMGKVKTGALIVVEDEILLTEYERTGITVDGVLTSQLLINIFEKNTPLHDGAVIVRGDRVVAATCYLPLTDSLSISRDLGTASVRRVIHSRLSCPRRLEECLLRWAENCTGMLMRNFCAISLLIFRSASANYRKLNY